eukprot:TRINITY_DN24825_c0_g1_i1.p1 TRINITY_DN24825_c0_g1~~TRINITY_DN24825_c0_g1_i1.p1  ORF type:complete len:193 (+),score=21.61 TRINITY_DN24825_c0_g1_i1:55-633(+)
MCSAKRTTSEATASSPSNSHRSSASSRPSPKGSCTHNNWDNVRAASRLVTLRCRECQKQKRVVTFIDWKCKAFTSPEGCSDESCTKYHVNYKKQCLEERVKVHGAKIMHNVRLKHIRPSLKLLDNAETDDSATSTRDLGSETGSESIPCETSPHGCSSVTSMRSDSFASSRRRSAQYYNNPYGWDESVVYIQ